MKKILIGSLIIASGFSLPALASGRLEIGAYNCNNRSLSQIRVVGQISSREYGVEFARNGRNPGVYVEGMIQLGQRQSVLVDQEGKLIATLDVLGSNLIFVKIDGQSARCDLSNTGLE